MIVPATGFGGESPFDLLRSDVDTLMGVANSGVDVNGIPTGSLTADHFKLTSPSSGTSAVALLPGGVSLAAGGTGLLTLTISTQAQGLGVGDGQRYIATPQIDVFVDPSGSGSGVLSISSIYNVATVSAPGTQIYMASVNVSNTATKLSNQMMQVNVWVHNFDASAHYFYVAWATTVINTALTGAS